MSAGSMHASFSSSMKLVHFPLSGKVQVQNLGYWNIRGEKIAFFSLPTNVFAKKYLFLFEHFLQTWQDERKLNDWPTVTVQVMLLLLPPIGPNREALSHN